jgi:plasmid stabilization system protein ParE
VRRYRVSRAADVTRDLDLIEEHLVRVYQELGDDLEDAMDRAAARIDSALAYMQTFASRPHRGTEHKALRPGVRSVTNKSFVFYFEIDELLFAVRILATFFGGADHRRQILDRFLH